MRVLRLFALVAAALAAAVTSAQPPEAAGAPPVVSGAVRTDTPNSKVHVFLVLDDNDAALKPDLDADEQAVTSAVRGGLGRIAKATGRAETDLVNWRPTYRKENVTAAKILGDIDAAPIGPTDTVFFCYGGHGVVDAAKGHTLTLDRSDTRHVTRGELYDKLRARNPALLIVCTDSCSPIRRVMSDDVKSQKQLGSQFVRPEDRLLEELFLKHRGVVDINSSAPGQLAWGFAGSGVSGGGGVFTQAFAGGLTADRKLVDKTGDDRVDWDEYFAFVAAETEKNFQAVKASAADAEPKLAAQKNQTLWTTTLVKHLRIGLRPVVDPATKEVRIAEVFDGRPAKAAGLAAGDVILEVGGRAVTDDRVLRTAIDAVVRDPASPIVFRVRTGTAEPRNVSVVPAY